MHAIRAIAEQRSATRKKTFAYPTWVRRTADSEEQVQRVTDHVLRADAMVKEYFSVVAENGEIASLHVDEWIALFEKKAAGQ